MKLPASYQAFAVRIGQKKFKNLNGDEGHDVVILPPQKLDFDTFRIPSEEDDGSPRRAVIFGAANSGDSYASMSRPITLTPRCSTTTTKPTVSSHLQLTSPSAFGNWLSRDAVPGS